jgi:hypothetical protein
MIKFTRFLPLALALPLAACFDMDMTVKFPDSDTAEMVSVMTASPEFYAMSQQGGDEDLCETGEGVVQDDGSFVCTETQTGTIEELMADPDMSEGMTLEHRDGGLIYVAFDLASLTSDMVPPEEDQDSADEMKGMLQDAFTGHAITINVAGSEIVETNGTISEDGKTATFEIPLTTMLQDQPDLPETFNTLLKPGS